MMKSALPISSGSSVNAMLGLSFALKSSLILPASTSKPVVGRWRGDTRAAVRRSLSRRYRRFCLLVCESFENSLLLPFNLSSTVYKDLSTLHAIARPQHQTHSRQTTAPAFAFAPAAAPAAITTIATTPQPLPPSIDHKPLPLRKPQPPHTRDHSKRDREHRQHD